jgi:hypothetical protein
MKKLLIGTALLFTALPFTFDGVTPTVSKAHAIIGRPLTPFSVAGVHRRAMRRTYGVGWRGGVGYGRFGYGYGIRHPVAAAAIYRHRRFGYGYGFRHPVAAAAIYRHRRFAYGYHPLARAAVVGAAAAGTGWGWGGGWGGWGWNRPWRPGLYAYAGAAPGWGGGWGWGGAGWGGGWGGWGWRRW